MSLSKAFGIFNKPGEPERALLFTSPLFIPATLQCLWLPQAREEAGRVGS